ncbi:MFS transporter [candidate division KSB1 bacterium]|nr:MFS transporter [candidate division KSB1 bacterium]
MSKTFEQALPPQSFVSRIPFYYGWVNMIFAAIAMVATLPARSVGIGLITEPLLQDLNLQRVSFGQMNFWATLAGASFSLLCGPAIDRFGVRTVVTVVLFALSWIVLAFSSVASAAMLLVLLILMRGFGQSALSVVSLTMIGKWFVRRLSKAMGVFSVLVSLGFVVAIVLSENAVLEHGWRTMWATLGWGLMFAAGLSLLFVRRSPESVGLEPDRESATQRESQESATGFNLKGALMTPAFWIFAVGSALYNLVIAGVLLFNQSILNELGFDETVFRNAMAIFMFMGLAGNLLAGWLGKHHFLGRLMTIAMLLVSVYLLTFPYLTSQSQVLVHAATLGLSGGVVSVVFFTAFGKVFGRPHLGKIQGAAQVLTVFASASGPWILASVFENTGSYSPAFSAIALPIAVVAIAAWFVRIPKPEESA